MMDQDKSKRQLLEELAELRQRVAVLETVESQRQRSEERYSTLVETVPQMLWWADANRQTVECNRRWHEYTGQTPEEARNLGWMNTLHPDDVARVTERMREAQVAGELYQAEYRMRRASDGSYRWHLSRALPIEDKDGKVAGWVGSVTDIDEQKRAEEALRKAHDELEQRVQERTAELTKANEELAIFRRFAEASGEGFGMAAFDGRIAYVNPTLCRWFGEEKPSDVIGQSVFTYYQKEYVQRRQNELIPTLLREGHWHIEQTVLPRHGKPLSTLQSTFLIRDENGSPFRIAVVISDITARKQAEEAVRESEEKYRTLVEMSPDAVIMLDPEGHITFASQRGVELYGAERVEELLGRNPLDFFAPEDQQRFRATLRRTLDEGVTRDVEYTLLRKDGSRFSGEGSAAVIRDGAGKPKALVAIVRDITERKQAQEALERERQSLWRMLQASDHERQVISYDIHDGLAQYLAAATMQFQSHDALRENSPSEAKKAYETAVQLVRQAHSEARRLINEVRPPVIDEIGLETAISHLVHEQRRHGGPKIHFDSNVQFDRLPPILENAIYRIIQEALTNACRHSNSKKVKVTMTQEGQDARLEVRDWGIGFDPESVKKGHFGLEGIRQRVRLLGGRLVIESTPGSGTMLQVVVPILEKQSEEQGDTPADSP